MDNKRPETTEERAAQALYTEMHPRETLPLKENWPSLQERYARRVRAVLSALPRGLVFIEDDGTIRAPTARDL